MNNSEYKIFMTPADANPIKPINDFHYLFMVNPDTFSNLAGLLCVGYYMHQLCIPIIANAKNPENNLRNVGLGYGMVLGTYIIVGTCGYIAFTGYRFDKDKDATNNDEIEIT